MNVNEGMLEFFVSILDTNYSVFSFGFNKQGNEGRPIVHLMQI